MCGQKTLLNIRSMYLSIYLSISISMSISISISLSLYIYIYIYLRKVNLVLEVFVPLK